MIKSVSLTKESAAVFLWKKGEAMFKEGDFIIYGSNGVCQVEHIGSMDLQGVPGDKMYCTLVPVYEEKSRLFTPVDNHKVVMRPVISKQEACDLLMRPNRRMISRLCISSRLGRRGSLLKILPFS